MILIGAPKLINYYWLSIVTSPVPIRVPSLPYVQSIPKASYFIQEKARILALAHLSLRDLPLLPHWFHLLLFTHSCIHPRLALLLFLGNIRYTLVSGPLHLLPPISGKPILQIDAWLAAFLHSGLC